MGQRFRDFEVGMNGVVNDKHFWVARDGRAWAFVLVEVQLDAWNGRFPEPMRLAFLSREDDLE